MSEKITEKELAKAWEILDSWQRVAYDYSDEDEIDEESPKLFNAIETIKKHFDNQNAEIEKMERKLNAVAKAATCTRKRDIAICKMNLELIEKLKTAKADARNEFAEEIYEFFCVDDNWKEFRSQWLESGSCPWLAKTLNALANGETIEISNNDNIFGGVFLNVNNNAVEDGSEEN